MKYLIVILIALGIGALAAIGWVTHGQSEAHIRQVCDNIGVNERQSGRMMGMPEQTAKVFGERARLKCLSREGLKG